MILLPKPISMQDERVNSNQPNNPFFVMILSVNNGNINGNGNGNGYKQKTNESYEIGAIKSLNNIKTHLLLTFSTENNQKRTDGHYFLYSFRYTKDL